jgi:ubiquinone/menaquinone biosynthesis C-methylase UbiE
LAARAASAGLSERIQTKNAGMESLPFADASFDLIWSEG